MERDRKAVADLADVDSPELSDEILASMRPAADVVPRIVERARKRGQRGPQKKPTKEIVTMRMHPLIVRHFKKGGDKWQTRMNDLLFKIVTGEVRVVRKSATGKFFKGKKYFPHAKAPTANRPARKPAVKRA